MIIMDDVVRDVLCKEVVMADKAAKAGVMCDVEHHLKNISMIMLSENDMVHVLTSESAHNMAVRVKGFA